MRVHARAAGIVEPSEALPSVAATPRRRDATFPMLRLAATARVCVRVPRVRLLHATQNVSRAPVVSLEEMAQWVRRAVSSALLPPPILPCSPVLAFQVDTPVDDLSVIDVRGRDEVASDGALGDSVRIVPLPELPAALEMGEEDFEAEYGFAKPKAGDTLVFTCKAGVRSEAACEIANAAGYSKCVRRVPTARVAAWSGFLSCAALMCHTCSVKNFLGGAQEWCAAALPLSETAVPRSPPPLPRPLLAMPAFPMSAPCVSTAPPPVPNRQNRHGAGRSA